MSRVLIAGAAPRAGEEEYYASLLGRYPVVIAADAAGEWCLSLGRVPDMVVGDFDSSGAYSVGRLEEMGVTVEVHPAVKDRSDLDLCLTAARGMGAGTVAFTAAFSDRLDHTLASLGTVLRAADLGATVREPDLTGWALDAAHAPSVTFEVGAGTVFSVIAPGGADGVFIGGAEYPLSGATLDALDSLGLSNVAVGGPVKVAIASGAVLVLVNGRVSDDIDR